MLLTGTTRQSHYLLAVIESTPVKHILQINIWLIIEAGKTCKLRGCIVYCHSLGYPKINNAILANKNKVLYKTEKIQGPLR